MNLDTNKIKKEESLEKMDCYQKAKLYQADMFAEIDKLEALFKKENK